MIITLIIYAMIVFWGARFNPKGTSDYLAINNTNAVKGIFILMVFMSHFRSYIGSYGMFGEVYGNFFRFFDQSMVALFLFYSGYGIMESYKKKGDTYISQMPLKRILATLFRFDCAILLFIAANVICRYKMEPQSILLAFTGWEAVGNSNWYIFVILVLYVVSFLAFKLLKGKKDIWPVLLTAALTAALVVVAHYTHVKPIHWYDTALIFPLGMLWSLYGNVAAKIFNRNIFVWSAWILALGVAYLEIKGYSTLFTMAAYIIFTMAFVVITMRITFGNKVLSWCGRYLFEIYILQRLPMMVLGRYGAAQLNPLIYFSACVAATVALAVGFKYITDKMWNKMIGK